MEQRKMIFTIRNIIVFIGLSNAIIVIAASIYNANLSWLLLISMPILIAGIYSRHRKSLTGTIWHYWAALKKKAKSEQWLPGSIHASKLPIKDLKVMIGNDQCSQPYSACIFNMGSIKNAHTKSTLLSQVIDKNPDHPGSSCEGRLHTYPFFNEDHVLQVKAGYDDSGTVFGHINSKAFRDQACHPEVKLIELMVPAAIQSLKRTESIFDCEAGFNPKKSTGNFPGSLYGTFRNAEGVIYFLDYLRELSGRKPTGLRLSISNKKEFRNICYAIRKTQLMPDFIVIEGPAENAFPTPEAQDTYRKMPLYEALVFVSQTLQVYGLGKEIKIIASGEFKSSFDILTILALGAALVCTTPYGIYDRNALPFYKGSHACEFQDNLMKAIVQTMEAFGFKHVSDITLPNFLRKLDVLLKGSASISSDFYTHTIKKGPFIAEPTRRWK